MLPVNPVTNPDLSQVLALIKEERTAQAGRGCRTASQYAVKKMQTSSRLLPRLNLGAEKLSAILKHELRIIQ